MLFVIGSLMLLPCVLWWWWTPTIRTSLSSLLVPWPSSWLTSTRQQGVSITEIIHTGPQSGKELHHQQQRSPNRFFNHHHHHQQDTVDTVDNVVRLRPPRTLVSSVSSVCACQPVEYEFTLDFSRISCHETNLRRETIQANMGLDSVHCEWIPVSAKAQAAATAAGERTELRQELPPKHELQLTTVSFVQMHEYNMWGLWLNNPDIDQETSDIQAHWDNHPNLDGPFYNGNSFAYTSLIAQQQATTTLTTRIDPPRPHPWRPPPDDETSVSQPQEQQPQQQEEDDPQHNADLDASQQLPSSLQIHLFGQNRHDELVELHVTLNFSNDCHAFPVLRRGDFVGPIVVVRV